MNRFRGEADLQGKGSKKYVLKFGSRALCQLMDDYDEPTDAALFKRLGTELSPEGQTGVNQRVLRRVLMACVEPPLLDISGADEIIDECGEAAVIDAFSACVHGRNTGGAENPPTPAPKRRTPSGKNSSDAQPK